MIMPTQSQMTTTVAATCMWPSGGDAEIVSSGSDRQRHCANETPLSSDLDALATMTYAELHSAWRRYYRTVPVKKISRDILELGIAWKIQEGKFGGLGNAVKRQIADLSRTMEARSDLAKPRAVTPKPGARLLRTWNGVTHHVVAIEDGFLWAGRTWRSLSVIAREITGTRWSGPRFFGLNAPPNAGASEQKAEATDRA